VRIEARPNLWIVPNSKSSEELIPQVMEDALTPVAIPVGQTESQTVVDPSHLVAPMVK